MYVCNDDSLRLQAHAPSSQHGRAVLSLSRGQGDMCSQQIAVMIQSAQLELNAWLCNLYKRCNSAESSA